MRLHFKLGSKKGVRITSVVQATQRSCSSAASYTTCKLFQTEYNFYVFKTLYRIKNAHSENIQFIEVIFNVVRLLYLRLKAKNLIK